MSRGQITSVRCQGGTQAAHGENIKPGKLRHERPLPWPSVRHMHPCKGVRASSHSDYCAELPGFLGHANKPSKNAELTLLGGMSRPTSFPTPGLYICAYGNALTPSSRDSFLSSSKHTCGVQVHIMRHLALGSTSKKPRCMTVPTHVCVRQCFGMSKSR